MGQTSFSTSSLTFSLQSLTSGLTFFLQMCPKHCRLLLQMSYDFEGPFDKSISRLVNKGGMRSVKNIHFFIFLACVCAALLSILADTSNHSTAGFGFLQLSLLVISGILGGFFFRRWLFPEKYQWDWVLTVLYLAGTIFAGLKPGHNYFNRPSSFLGNEVILLQDVIINILGFLPLGFLMMATLTKNKSKKTAAIITIITCVGTSFMIEATQYCCVSGRISSLVDLMTNSAGLLVGVLLFFIYEFLLKRTEG